MLDLTETLTLNEYVVDILDFEFNLDLDLDFEFKYIYCITLIQIISLNFILFLKDIYVYLYNIIKNFITVFISTINKSEALRVCFISIYVATILTLYEIILFYFFVVPEIYREINSAIILMSNNIKLTDLKISFQPTYIFDIIDIFNISIPFIDTNINPYQNVYPLSYLNFFETFENKANDIFIYLLQNKDIQKFILSIFYTLNEREIVIINKINDYTIVTSFLLLGFLIFSLLLIKKKLNDRNEELGVKVWISCWFTVVMIILFQYSFFVYANKYKYIGSTNINELIYFILNYL
jgi:hypothetical protein